MFSEGRTPDTPEANTAGRKFPYLQVAADQARWYAVYTMPRHEKAVRDQLTTRAVENYLPVYEKRSRWKDRMAQVQLPLFPGYIFVHVVHAGRVRVLETPGVLHIVSFSGRPAPLAEEEIQRLRDCVALRRAEPFPYLCAGGRVRVEAGPLAGLEGIVLRRKGKVRVVVSIPSIRQSMAVELDASEVAALSVVGSAPAPPPGR